MTEDDVLTAGVEWLKGQGWQLCYLTRPLAEGAIGGVDAILFKLAPQSFAFVDAKGDSGSKEAKSAAFTNCLGALMKRIRVCGGYAGVEAKSRFIAAAGLKVPELRRAVQEKGLHRSSLYYLVLPESHAQTVESALDPALASLLHIHVLMVGSDGVREHQW